VRDGTNLATAHPAASQHSSASKARRPPGVDLLSSCIFLGPSSDGEGSAPWPLGKRTTRPKAAKAGKTCRSLKSQAAGCVRRPA